MRFVLACALALSWSALLSCSSSSKNEETADGGGNGGSGAATGGGGSTGGSGASIGKPCNGGTCVASPEPGWDGPVAVYLGPAADAPACAKPYPQPTKALNTDLEAASAGCGPCDCAASNVQCSATVHVKYTSNGLCSALAGDSWTGSVPDNGSQCDSDGAMGACPLSYSQWIESAAPGGTADCTPNSTKPSISVPPHTWKQKLVACAPESFGSDCSGGELCAPATPGTLDKLCIFKAGEQSCPASEYSVKTIAYGETVIDERSCADCACGSPAMSCDGLLKTWVGASFNQLCSKATAISPDYPVPGATCAPGGTGQDFIYFEYHALNPSAVCPGAASAPIGEVKPTDPTTFCCTQ